MEIKSPNHKMFKAVEQFSVYVLKMLNNSSYCMCDHQETQLCFFVLQLITSVVYKIESIGTLGRKKDILIHCSYFLTKAYCWMFHH